MLYVLENYDFEITFVTAQVNYLQKTALLFQCNFLIGRLSSLIRINFRKQLTSDLTSFLSALEYYYFEIIFVLIIYRKRLLYQGSYCRFFIYYASS